MLAFWRHATYSAALAQALANSIGGRLPIKPGVANLAGLLHNFGYLLAGHLFRAEFFLHNRVVATNPPIPIPLIQRRVFGIDHTPIGDGSETIPPAAILTALGLDLDKARQVTENFRGQRNTRRHGTTDVGAVSNLN